MNRLPLLLTSVTLASLTLLTTAASAQQASAAPLVSESQPLEARKNQKVERIRTEDTAVVIDEVRYGGETRSITVQPKGDLPAYEIQPTDMGRSRPADNRDGMSNANGRRVWNVLSF
ncbi:MAG: hypothetical protein V4684_13305 [Pseudomonadota bacterium]